MKANARTRCVTAAAGTPINRCFYAYPQKCTTLVHSFTITRHSLRQNNLVTLSRIAKDYALVTAIAQQILVWLAENSHPS